MRANGVRRAALLALLIVPVITLAWSLYVDHGMLFWDAKTIPCGVQAYLAGGDPNAYLRNPGYAGACAGYGYEYMLPPAVTHVLGGLWTLLGDAPLRVLYALVYLLSLGLILAAARRLAPAPGAAVAAAALMVCGVFVFEAGGGNLTVVFLAALLATALYRPDRMAWLVPLCAVAAFVKPFYALYLLVPLFARPRLALTVLAAVCAVSVGYALDAALHPAEFDRWLRLSVAVVYGEPHFGVLRILDELGIGAGHWPPLALLYAAWSAGVVAVLYATRRHDAEPRDRACAALLAATLIQPRLKEYDAFVVVPLIFWLTARLPPRRGRQLRTTLIVVAGVVPALWWWGRKVLLFVAVPHPTLTQIADPRWLIATQGFFLAAVALLLFLVLAARLDPPGTRP